MGDADPMVWEWREAGLCGFVFEGFGERVDGEPCGGYDDGFASFLEVQSDPERDSCGCGWAERTVNSG